MNTQSHIDTQKSNSRFSARYIKIMAISSFIVLAISATLLVIESNRKIVYEQDRYASEFRSHSLALDSLVVSIGEHLNAFEEIASHFFRDQELKQDYDSLSNFSSKENYTYQFLADAEQGFYHLDRLPTGYAAEYVGNLTGEGSIGSVDKALSDEITMALLLNSAFQAAKENIPDSSWIYYTSKNKFINIYPWVVSSGFRYSDELLTHEFYHWGLPEVNPERATFWTPAYIDEAGEGLMVTSAKPVYRNDEFLGTVAIDITLHQLIAFAQEFEPELGQMMIINKQNQLIAHHSLANASGDAKIMKVKTLNDVLPIPLQEDAQKLFQQDEMTVQKFNQRYYMWYSMKNAPWRVLYLFNDDQFNLGYKARLNADFFLLIAALAIILYVSYKVTFKEFIFPAEKLVNHIALENEKGAEPESTDQENNKKKEVKVPPPWRPWFAKITQVFAENHNMIEEIKEKNEILLEKNTALERYMPKTIIILDVEPRSGSTTIGNYLSHTFAAAASSDTKSTVYLEFPNMGKVFKDFDIKQKELTYHHPDGYDIWGGYDFGVMPEDAHPSMLINKLLENYNNVVLNLGVNESGILPSEQEVFLNYAKVIILVAPHDEAYCPTFDRLCDYLRQQVRQDKTSIYVLKNEVQANQESPCTTKVTIDFSIPYLPDLPAFSADSFSLPEAAQPVMTELVDRVERVHQISVFIPTTINIDEVVDTSGYVERTMAFFGEKFGGATCNEANGVWNSSKGDLVSETVNIVVSYTTEDSLNMYVDDVIEYVKVIKDELSQDAMAIEINKKLILI
ncbi:hypothetical protein CBF23_010310 [Marinomonas agarivorans]|nr:hypothetical protein CBF23_010310 [Marinomonas agarivorans]